MTLPIREISELPPDTSRGYIINIVAWVGCGISTACVVLRLYSRIYIIQRPGWDDAIVGFAALLNISSRALISVGVAHGLGRHINYLSSEDTYVITYLNPILETIGILAFFLPKLAIAILIKKLMGRATHGIWFLYGVVTVLFAMGVPCIIIIFLECNPPGEILHPFSSTLSVPCVPVHACIIFNTLTSAWSAFTDLVLAVSPAFFLWNLRMKASRKLTVILIMALGFFAMIAAIAKALQLPRQNSHDVTYEIFWLYIPFILETDLVIIASCAPAFLKLWARLFNKKQGQSSRSQYHPVRPSWYGYQRQRGQDDMTGPYPAQSPSLSNGQKPKFNLGRPLGDEELEEMDEW
ncbi:hypothetical protein GGR51DRAFT_455648 [Nemania sp. FL0031]|nr:hypothetical protein GGR51DRAFT_455648 [Nemania sp. FL0031]